MIYDPTQSYALDQNPDYNLDLVNYTWYYKDYAQDADQPTYTTIEVIFTDTDNGKEFSRNFSFVGSNWADSDVQAALAKVLDVSKQANQPII